MTKGVILFAFNSPNFDYYKMAEFAAKRINHFLNLPVTLITSKESLDSSTGYSFDNTLILDVDYSNTLNGKMWLNKGRYNAYELSPYDQTLLLDVDYVVNSNMLLKTFELGTDFCCHETVNYLMSQHNIKETISFNSLPSLWATVVNFKKTKRAKQIFDCLKMIQHNYDHYANIHNLDTETFRNDFALTLSWRIVNGHIHIPTDIIPWNLTHLGKKIKVYKNAYEQFNTEYTIIYDNYIKNKLRKDYIVIKDMDFHVLNKNIYMEILHD